MSRKSDATSFQSQDKMHAIQAQRAGSGRETASPKGGLTHGTTMHPHDSAQARRDGKGLTWTGAAAGFDHYRVKEGTRPDTQTSGTSIFDPVLCELAYRWFCPPGGTVLDPFAGGSVRGIVASVLGRSYVGIDLSERQLAANREQAAAICRSPLPRWIQGDSRHIRTLAGDVAADFIMACPPYADLERYSDDPADLSTLSYAEFRAAYRIIIAETAALLRPDRFACFVVGDVRDGKGFYHGLPWHTVEAFEAVGLRLYNEAVLVTAVGSLPIRAGRQFEAGRKLGKTHQNVLVFCKGDPKAATAAIGPVEFAEIGEQPDGPPPIFAAPSGDALDEQGG